MRYVQRDQEGKVIGHFANPQPQPDGTMLTDPEPLPYDHPDILEFQERLLSVAS